MPCSNKGYIPFHQAQHTVMNLGYFPQQVAEPIQVYRQYLQGLRLKKIKPEA